MLGQQAAITLAVADYHKIQIAALQAKINPHFLHNSLSVIAELVSSDPSKAEAAILKLSKLYRYILNASADHIVPLDQEIAITRDYLAIEQFRCGERLQVEFEVHGAPSRVQVPALILQPLVENAIRHGVGRKVGPGTVRVEIRVEAESCSLSVQDDGPGWRGGTSSGGFGLRSVRERLNLLYRGASELSIQRNQGVKVEMRFPLRPSHEMASAEDGPGPAELAT
jgi:LytS/YehU family sensor histidine kinase